MQSHDNINARFTADYGSVVKDPVVLELIRRIEEYHQRVQQESMLSVYSQYPTLPTEALNDVLARHLFGQMFPGPVFVVLEASLRDPSSAYSSQLDGSNLFAIQDADGNEHSFAPRAPVTILPALSNDVKIETEGDDLVLVLDPILKNLSKDENGFLSIFTGTADRLLVERLRCRMQSPKSKLPVPSQWWYPYSPVTENYASSVPSRTIGILEDDFRTTYDSRFLQIPYDLLFSSQKQASQVRLRFENLASCASVIEGSGFVANSFIAWNMIFRQSEPPPDPHGRYAVPANGKENVQTIVTHVIDRNGDQCANYLDAAATIDPSFPNQYTLWNDAERDEILIEPTPPPRGRLIIRYCQYGLLDSAVGISSGRVFHPKVGVDPHLKSVRSLTSTERLGTVHNGSYVWNRFRELLASRDRMLTRDDLRLAIRLFPPFANQSDIVDIDNIQFRDKVGRWMEVDELIFESHGEEKGDGSPSYTHGHGSLVAPYTEISVPVRDPLLLLQPDRSYFEKEMYQYLKARTVHGNFLNVRFIPAGNE